MRSSLRTTRTPSTWITALTGSTRVPNSRTTLPSTLTRPSAIRSSAARRLATPALDSTFCSRTPSGSDIVDRIHFGQEGSDGRQVRQGRKPQPLQEQLGRAVKNATSLPVRTGLLDEAPENKRPDHPIHVNPTHSRDPRTRDGLAVRDHREGLQSGPGQLGPLPPEQELLHVRREPVTRVEAPTTAHVPQVDAPLLLVVLLGEVGEDLPDAFHRLVEGVGEALLVGGPVDDQQQRLQRGL